MNSYNLKSSCYWIELSNRPIYEQLQLEEGLLRSSQDNFVIVNKGSPEALVLGISQKFENEVNYIKWEKNPIPVIKRYSGGGAVVVDASTFFVSFIMNSSNKSRQNPESIHNHVLPWYQPLFKHANITLRENDYVIGSKKVGGNAQSITRSRWVHHTTFLYQTSWDLMQLLNLPIKQPDYRQKRTHTDFCQRLDKSFNSMDEMVDLLKIGVESAFEVKEVIQNPWEIIDGKEFRRSVYFLKQVMTV